MTNFFCRFKYVSWWWCWLCRWACWNQLNKVLDGIERENMLYLFIYTMVKWNHVTNLNFSNTFHQIYSLISSVHPHNFKRINGMGRILFCFSFFMDVQEGGEPFKPKKKLKIYAKNQIFWVDSLINKKKAPIISQENFQLCSAPHWFHICLSHRSQWQVRDSPNKKESHANNWKDK